MFLAYQTKYKEITGLITSGPQHHSQITSSFPSQSVGETKVHFLSLPHAYGMNFQKRLRMRKTVTGLGNLRRTTFCKHIIQCLCVRILVVWTQTTMCVCLNTLHNPYSLINQICLISLHPYCFSTFPIYGINYPGLFFFSLFFSLIQKIFIFLHFSFWLSSPFGGGFDKLAFTAFW